MADSVERANQPFDDILERCLQALTNGQATVEECVARYPEYPELGDLLTLATAVKTLPRPVMSATYTVKTQRQLQQQFRQRFRAMQPTRRAWWQLLPRFVTAMSIVIALIVVGSAVVIGASLNTIPGDTLYPVKRTVEQARLTFADITNSQTRPDLLYAFAKARITEVSQIAASGQPISDAFLNEVTDSISNAVLSNPQSTVQTALIAMATDVLQRAQNSGAISTAGAARTFSKLALLSKTVVQSIPPTSTSIAVAMVTSSTATVTATFTPTATPTLPPTFTATATPTLIPHVLTSTMNPTLEALLSATLTPSFTATVTPTVTLTPRPTRTRTKTFTPTSSFTPIPTTEMPTLFFSNTLTAPTAIPIHPATSVPLPTSVPTEPGVSTATTAPSATDVPTSAPNTPTSVSTSAPTEATTISTAAPATVTASSTPSVTKNPTATPTHIAPKPRPSTPTSTATQPPTLIPLPSGLPSADFKQAPQEITFNTCPPNGSNGDSALNLVKNRVDDGNYQTTPFDSLAALQWPKEVENKSRDQWSQSAKDDIAQAEGLPVLVDGYIAKVQENDVESQNCRAVDHKTWQLWLLSTPGTDLSKAVIVGVTPRVRANHAGWTLDKLTALVNTTTKVRVGGWLTFNNGASSDDIGKSRLSLWEIHPAMQIAVANGDQWINLDDYHP